MYFYIYVCHLSVSIELRVNANFEVFEADLQNVLKNRGPN